MLCVSITGPGANIHHNMEEAALSLTCNMEQQVNHSRLLWRETLRPARIIMEALMVS